MKQFNLEKAKKGCKVCTRRGSPVRIICFDRKSTYSIVALVDDGINENCLSYTKEGKFYADSRKDELDLFLNVEKHEGWINLYRDAEGIIEPGSTIHTSKKEAIKHSISSKNRVGTIRIEWEE